MALDYGMGQGRNSIYLASLGREVWGFDPSEGGIAIAQKRAKELGLILHISVVIDSEYDFGKQRFDLILFNWTMPATARSAHQVIASTNAINHLGRKGLRLGRALLFRGELAFSEY